MVFLLMLVFRFVFLMILGSESGFLGLEEHAFGMRCIAKKTFAGVGILLIPTLIFEALVDFHGPEAPPDPGNPMCVNSKSLNG